MSSLTAVLYGALVVYLGGWFLGYWIGNFSLLLFVLTLVTLVYWLAERLALPAGARGRRAIAGVADSPTGAPSSARKGIDKVDGDVAEAQADGC